MDERAVVTCFLRNEGAVLLFKRSGEVGSYSGRWGAVAGHAEGNPDAAASQEIREETGLDPDGDVTLVRRGEPFTVEDDERGTRWLVHPYLFDAATRGVEVNWETSECEWVAPTAILHRETVPQLWTSYDRVRPTVETVATDRDHGAAYISVRALEVLRDEAALAAQEVTAGEHGATAADTEAVADVARALLAARPSMSVVRNRVNRVMHAAGEDATRSVEHVAAAAIERAVSADRRAAEQATDFVTGRRVATLSRSGTVLQALRDGDPEAVLVAESRPGREGVDVAEALADETDVTLTTDAGLASALADWEADCLLVGADTVLADGRVVNKVGTRSATIAASFEGIEVLVATAVDKLSPDGEIDLEPRDASEVYEDGNVAVTNPTFDVAPPECIDGVVTERGLLDGAAVADVVDQHRGHAEW
jgi:translation initiation factor 2B subunit (eIF-2B alpha/beta/delta family)/8-oxo-dGTP pyrophosphatase MutT (NUDIX family)